MPGGFPGFGGGMPGGRQTFHFSTGGPGGFRPSPASSIFENFMRESAMGGGGGMEDFLNNLSGGGGGPSPTSGSRGGRTRQRFNSDARAPSPDVTTVEKPLLLSLEELFSGTHKRMKIKRKTFDDSGKRSTEDKILEMDIKPGLKKGSKIKYKGVGDEEAGGQQDLHFIVEEVSHGTPPFPYIRLTALTILIERPPSIHTRRRRPNSYYGTRFKRSSHRLATHCRYH